MNYEGSCDTEDWSNDAKLFFWSNTYSLDFYKNIFCINVQVFTVTLDQFKASLNKSINFFKKESYQP